MKKLAAILLTAALAVSCTCVFAACGDESAEKISALIGRFESSGNLNKTLTNDAGYKDRENSGDYIYTSDVYPLNTVVEESVTYYYTQTLRLKRDFTYDYTYDVQLRKVAQAGNTDLAKIEIDIQGAFTFDRKTETDFTVTLSDPTAGKENFYGASIVGQGNIYAWKLSSSPSYALDIAQAVASDADFGFDRYTAGRTVEVVRGEERVLKDNVFYADFLCDIAPYCSFDNSAETPEEPDVPDVPDEPEVPDSSVRVLELPFDVANGIGMSLSVAAGPTVNYRVPADVKTVAVNGKAITEYTSAGGENIFAVPLAYADLANELTVIAGSRARTKAPAKYLRDIIAVTPPFTGATRELEAQALMRVAVSVLYYAAQCGADVKLADEQIDLVYESVGVNKYHTDFTARDTLSVAGNAADGFAWGGVPRLGTEDGATLTYTFAVPTGSYLKLSARAETAANTDVLPVTEVSAADGNTTYSFTTRVYGPLEYADNIAVTVFDGENQIGSVASYSVTRAIAKADLSAEENVRQMSKAYYSLGKAAAWLHYRDQIAYCRQPAASNGNGRYDFAVSEYSYSQAFIGPTVAKDDGAAALYVGGTVTSNAAESVVGDAFKVEKTDDAFRVTLYGGTVDGIAPANNQPIGGLTVVVNADTTLENIMIPMWGVTGANAAITAPCDVSVTGAPGAVLTVKGNITAKNISIEKVIVNVVNAASSDGVACDALTVKNGGELNVAYTGLSATTAGGVNARGSVRLDGGKLSSDGYYNGVWLGGDGAQTLTVAGASRLYVKAAAYGVTGSAPTAAGAAVNRRFGFTGGESYIEAGSGLKYADVAVGDAALTVIANNGYTIESEDASRPVTFATTSRSEKLGEITLVNNFYNPYWDVNYTLKVKEMNLNGGSVYIFGMCKDGVIHTYAGSIVTVQNCDFTIENGQDLGASYGRGFNAQSGDEIITVTNSGKVVFKNCDAAVSCWSKGADAESYATLVNEGLIILDTFKLGLDDWELAAWSNNLIVTGNGQVRATNKL